MQKIKLKTKEGKEVNAFVKARDYKKIYGFENRRKSLMQRIIKKLRGEEREKTMPHKCGNFEKAKEEGTDNEGYIPLVYENNYQWYMGSDMPRITYCPWCGEKTNTKEGKKC